jgi:hypothetical protein
MLLVVLCAGVPASARSGEQPHEGSTAAFYVAGTNGYRVMVLAGSKRSDGRGVVSILAISRHGFVGYSAPATVAPFKVEADLGRLGAIDLELVPTGGERTVDSCAEEKVTFLRAEYRGKFVLRGEEGFARAEATAIPVRPDILARLVCSSSTSFGEFRGPGLPGAWLRVASTGKRSPDVELEVMKNGPRARTRLSVEVTERRGRIAIERATERLLGPSALRFDSPLRAATVSPPAPFAGSAEFDRDAGPAGRWRGNLTVDLPGRSDFPLTGPALRSSLVPANWTHSTSDRPRPPAR